MKLYKLTDQNNQTRNDTQWGEGVTHTATGDINQDLCSDGWIHAYEHPLLAVMFNPIHGNFKNPKLWEAEGEIGKRDYQVKCGCRTLTTIKEIPLPKITTEEILKFTILCTLEIYKDKGFKVWADKWISGEDRSTNAAYAANAAATAYAAANAANAADAAAYAANAAADAADAAFTAANAATSTAYVATAAAATAYAAAQIGNLDLVKYILKAIS